MTNDIFSNIPSNFILASEKKYLKKKENTFKIFHISENNIISVKLVQVLIKLPMMTKSAYLLHPTVFF